MGGGLVRCDGCGGLQWSPLHLAPDRSFPECSICGDSLKPERRRPGTKFADLSRERRNLFAAGPKRVKQAPRPIVQP
jgi:hypothetical protein